MRSILVVLGWAALLGVSMSAQAQTSGDYCSTTQNGLCANEVFPLFNPLEQAAASANQATFDRLDPACGPSATGVCTAGDRIVYESVRELVHTANGLSGDLATEFSLGLGQEGLGFALRWTAAEEMAAHGSMTTEFAASQLSALASRIAALRWGVTGLRSVDNGSVKERDRVLVANTGGGASADQEFVTGRWGWFLDGAFGYGDKADTTFVNGFEDGFDFDGQEITLGGDYRLSSSLTIGILVGYTEQAVDFDSSLSIVDGEIDSDGFSGQLYLMLEGDQAYLSASVGYQSLTYDVRRRIVYPSFNANVESTDSTALSSVDSSTFLASLGGGYQFRWGGFAVEPYFDTAYVDASIDSFVERSFPTGQPSSSSGDPTALRIGDQSIESLNTAVGLRTQYVFTPSFGVVIPYLRGAYHFESLNDQRQISARYENAIDSLAGEQGTDFQVSTDELDDDYYTVSAGFSVALPRGLQGFLQYLEVLDLDNYNESVISGGIRVEFQ